MEKLLNSYVDVTHEIEVTALPAYVPEKSSPERNYYFFAYKIKIRNQGKDPVQLTHRHWIITDGRGTIDEVDGEGVVGDKPLINPGEMYEYVSACPLSTPTGNMRGAFTMIRSDGERFDVNIPLFFLRTEVFH